MLTVLKGSCASYTGYGKVFRGLAERLLGRFPLELLALDNEVPQGCELPISEHPRGRTFGVLIGPANKVNQLTTWYKILFTMYEASDIPDDWKYALSRAQEIWVPSQFCREVFSSYHRRVKVVPIGFDERVFYHKKWGADNREHFWSLFCPEAVGKRVIGTAGVMSLRKGIDVLLRAWELAALEDAVLVIKTRDTKTDIRPVQDAFVIDQNWPDETIADFYCSCDLIVCPTRGDGLGLVPLEAAACGTPAMVTRASGPADYIDDRGIYGIEVAGLRHADNIRAQNAQWYEPDLHDLLEKVRAFVADCPRVEHGYRQWSMEQIANRWEAELIAASHRAGARLRVP